MAIMFFLYSRLDDGWSYVDKLVGNIICVLIDSRTLPVFSFKIVWCWENMHMKCLLDANSCRMWPKYVKDRVKSTYMYFGGSLAISAATAVGVFRTPALLRIVSYQGMMVSPLVSLYVLCIIQWFQYTCYMNDRWLSNCITVVVEAMWWGNSQLVPVYSVIASCWNTRWGILSFWGWQAGVMHYSYASVLGTEPPGLWVRFSPVPHSLRQVFPLHCMYCNVIFATQTRYPMIRFVVNSVLQMRFLNSKLQINFLFSTNIQNIYLVI